MKLTHARVRNFRSIIDTGKFSINDLCCLVGKNEAGKTATLCAIQSIRPYGTPQTTYDVAEDYPRRYAARYDERHKESEAVVVETWWQLCDKGYELLCDEFGDDAIRSREFTISKRYRKVNTIWTIDLDEAAAVGNILKFYRLDAAEQAVLGRCSTVKQVLSKLKVLTIRRRNLKKSLRILETIGIIRFNVKQLTWLVVWFQPSFTPLTTTE